MGQYWQLYVPHALTTGWMLISVCRLNLDKRQTGDLVGAKFMEFIFSGYDWFVALLARPEVPDRVPVFW